MIKQILYGALLTAALGLTGCVNDLKGQGMFQTKQRHDKIERPNNKPGMQYRNNNNLRPGSNYDRGRNPNRFNDSDNHNPYDGRPRSHNQDGLNHEYFGCPIGDNCDGQPTALMRFGFDSKKLSPESKSVLKNKVLPCMRETLRYNPERKWLLAGYASKEGERNHNIALSHDRAQAVANYIKEVTSNDSKLSNAICVTGRGPDSTFKDSNGKTDTEESYSRNRRVDISPATKCTK